MLQPVPNICARNRTLGEATIAAFNLSWPGLEVAHAEAQRDDLGAACDALVAYYRDSNTSAWLRKPRVPAASKLAGGRWRVYDYHHCMTITTVSPTASSIAPMAGSVDAMVQHDIFALAGVATTAKVPRNSDGGLDWVNKGPNNDVEFMNCLNRHTAFTDLLAGALNPHPHPYPYTVRVDKPVLNHCRCEMYRCRRRCYSLTHTPHPYPSP